MAETIWRNEPELEKLHLIQKVSTSILHLQTEKTNKKLLSEHNFHVIRICCFCLSFLTLLLSVEKNCGGGYMVHTLELLQHQLFKHTGFKFHFFLNERNSIGEVKNGLPNTPVIVFQVLKKTRLAYFLKGIYFNIRVHYQKEEFDITQRMA